MDEKALPRRKNIRLAECDYSETGAYFVTVCTHMRRCLFNTVGAHLCVRPLDASAMIEKWLREIENKYPGVFLDYHVVMPNHIHFILMIDRQAGAHTGAPLPEIIKWFKTQTTNDYIRGVKSRKYPPFDKHLWQRGYYEHIIRNDQDLTETRKYIDANPARWAEDEYYT